MIIYSEAVLLHILFFIQPCFQADKNSEELLVDISEDCKDNYTTSIHLPYGAGSADSRTILLNSADSSDRFCSVCVVGPHFQNNCKDKCIIALVVEMFNLLSKNESCFHGGIHIRSHDQELANVGTGVCDPSANNEREHPMQTYLIHTKKFTIDINFAEFIGTIKMIATSAKYLGNYGKCTKNEIYCVLNGQAFCIDKLLECDGNCNCGTPNLYDEFCNNLYVQENMLFVIIYGTFLVVVVIFFFVLLLRKCVPSVTDHFFIFNEDLEYNFVLTSQSLPPLDIRRIPEGAVMPRQQRSRATDTQIY